MSVVAGIDIGNSTTEIVLLREAGAAVEILASARALTRGVKGGLASIEAAGKLARRTAEKHGTRLGVARIAPLHPVLTRCRSVSQPPADTGPLWLVTRSARTASGDAAGVGRPVWLSDLHRHGAQPSVVLVGSRTHYAAAAEAINNAMSAGRPVSAVLVERDEAVLIANRLIDSLPVVDQVPVLQLQSVSAIAVEARPQGQRLRHLGDPYWLASTFGLDPAHAGIGTIVQEVEDSSYAVVALARAEHRRNLPGTASRVADHVMWKDGVQEQLPGAVTRVRTAAPGSIVGIRWSDLAPEQVTDFYVIALNDIALVANIRRGTIRTDRLVTALLNSQDTLVADPADVLAKVLDVSVETVAGEAAAGRNGALSTPGVPANAIVVDLGGGTVDVSDGGRQCVVAGGGELLTQVTAEALGVPTGTAEYVKRAPALYVQDPQVVVDENGTRTFLDTPAPSAAIGALCVEGPVGLVPFNRTLSLGEWRAWRTTAKAHSIGHNVDRAMAAIGIEGPAAVVLAGGAAGDDEMIAALTRILPQKSIIGRANVAGHLGHRFAVAYGLARGGASPT